MLLKCVFISDFFSACFVSSQNEKQAPCQHYGNASSVRNVRDIITRPLKTTVGHALSGSLRTLKFEDGNGPLAGIKCRFNLCTVTVNSVTLEITFAVFSME